MTLLGQTARAGTQLFSEKAIRRGPTLPFSTAVNLSGALVWDGMCSAPKDILMTCPINTDRIAAAVKPPR
jgi:hypothetical protein